LLDLLVPRLETDRLLLTPLGPEDAARMAAFYSDNRAFHKPWFPPAPDEGYTEAFWRDRLEASADELRLGHAIRFQLLPIEDPESGPILGVANFTQIVRGAFHSCYLGYALAESAQGKGLMYEALARVIPWVIATKQLHRIMANYMPWNRRSGDLLRRLGFTVEGYARDYLFIDDAWSDHVLTSFTNEQMERPSM
jgi:ribosomal-protein-alanine N-acetyltransferase